MHRYFSKEIFANIQKCRFEFSNFQLIQTNNRALCIYIYMINLLLVLIGFDTGGNRDQMKLRAGCQTESKIPPNLSFHSQIVKNKGFQAEKWQKCV